MGEPAAVPPPSARQLLVWLEAEIEEILADSGGAAALDWMRARPLAAALAAAAQLEDRVAVLEAELLVARPPDVREWKDLHPEAKGTVADVMRNADDALRLRAAELVVDRVEGKVRQGIDVGEAAGDLLATVFWRYVTAMHLAGGMAFEEAQRRAEADPDAVQAWGREVGLLGAGVSRAGVPVAEVVDSAPAAPAAPAGDEL